MKFSSQIFWCSDEAGIAAPAERWGRECKRRWLYVRANEQQPALECDATCERATQSRIPLRGVRLRDIHTLSEGALVESQWRTSDEVPLFAAGVVLSWCEFEGADQTMAVRLTRLA